MDALRPAVERALSESFGTDVRLHDAHETLDTMSNGYETVVRFRVASGADAPTVVVKRPGNWARYDPDPTEGTSWGFLNEWAALEMLNEADATIAPRLLAADRVEGFMVLEDLGDGDGVADLVLGDDADAARAGLVGLARTLGRMHAVTSDRRDAYMSRRRELGPLPDGDRHFAFDRSIPAFATACEQIGVEAAPSARDEADAVIDTLSAPGPFLAYVHGDPCPDNTRLVDGRVVLIDFEVGGFRHALLDGAYSGAPFPTCWCVNRIPDAVVDEMDGAYEAELSTMVAAARDHDAFEDAMLSAMAFWAMATTGWQVDHVSDNDELMYRGIHTRRQGVLLRWQTFLARAERLGKLDALVALGRAIVARLDELWPDVDPMPLYPAFR